MHTAYLTGSNLLKQFRHLRNSYWQAYGLRKFLIYNVKIWFKRLGKFWYYYFSFYFILFKDFLDVEINIIFLIALSALVSSHKLQKSGSGETHISSFLKAEISKIEIEKRYAFSKWFLELTCT